MRLTKLMFLKSLQSIFKTELAKVERLQMGTQLCRVLADLPMPLQCYFEYCGYSGNECARSVTIEWKNACLKFSPNGKWKKMDCDQVNVLTQPVRLVSMRRKLFGIFSFGAIDEFIQGRGQMLIKLFNFFTLNQAVGKEMDKAELVTILAETMLIPAYALQHYITWQEVNPKCVKGTICYNGISASGLFYFGEFGEILSFETDDRYYSGKNGRYEKRNWIAKIDNYREYGNHKIPSDFSAIWKLAEGDYEYFKGAVANISYASFQSYSVGRKYVPVKPRYISHQKLAFP